MKKCIVNNVTAVKYWLVFAGMNGNGADEPITGTKSFVTGSLIPVAFIIIRLAFENIMITGINVTVSDTVK